MKHLPIDIDKILKNNDLLTKVKFSFSVPLVDEWYDAEEGEASADKSYTNAVTVKMYVSTMSAEKMMYKTQGKYVDEAKVILCKKKYIKYFKKADKIEIDDIEYSSYNSATAKFSIEVLPHKRIRVTLYRK